MREGRRVRERFEMSLEPKQLALLFVLVLVILVLVFALGIIVGRGLKSPVTPPTTADVLDGDEAPPVGEAASPETAATEGDDAPKLKFYGEGATAPHSEASALAQEDEVGPPAPAAAPAAPKAKAEKPKAAEKKAEKKTEKKSEAKAKGTGKFTIQVSAFQSRSQADHLVSTLKHKGYDAYIAQASIPGKGVWYRVRIGNYASRDAAQAVANSLKRKENITTYVTLYQ